MGVENSFGSDVMLASQGTGVMARIFQAVTKWVASFPGWRDWTLERLDPSGLCQSEYIRLSTVSQGVVAELLHSLSLSQMFATSS